MYPSNIKSTLIQVTLALEPTATGVFNKTLSATTTEVPTATLEARQDWRDNRDRAKQKAKDAAARGRERGKEGSRQGEEARQRGVDKADAAADDNARARRSVRFADFDEIIPATPDDPVSFEESKSSKLKIEGRQDWRDNRDRAKQKAKDAAARGRERGKEGSRRGEEARQRGVDKADAAASENARLRHRAVRFAENDEIIPEGPGDEPKLVKSRACKADRMARFAEEVEIIH